MSQTMIDVAEVARLKEISFNKYLRTELDGLIKDLRLQPHKSAERTLAFRALQQARHWLGEDLAILGAQHPYPNGNNPANTIVDPPADVASRPSDVLSLVSVASGVLYRGKPIEDCTKAELISIAIEAAERACAKVPIEEQLDALKAV